MNTRLLALLRRLYAAALWLYPWRFRAAFGEEIQLVFADAVDAAATRGAAAVLGLCAREALGLPRSLLLQYIRAWRAEAARLRGQAVQPSWAQAIAAVAPGLMLVSGYWLFRLLPETYASLSTYAGWVPAGVGLLAGLWALRRGWRHSAWVWTPAGMLTLPALVLAARSISRLGPLVLQSLLVLAAALALGLILVRVRQRRPVARMRLLPRAAWALLGLMVLLMLARAVQHAHAQAYFGAGHPLALGLSLALTGLLPAGLFGLLLVAGRAVARWHGLGAVLLLLGPCAYLIDLLVDPTYGVRSSPLLSQALLAPLLRTLLYGGLLILAPFGVLRARTAAGQARAVLLGVAMAVAAVAIIPYLYWRQQLVDLVTLAALALGPLTALAAFGWEGVGEVTSFAETH